MIKITKLKVGIVGVGRIFTLNVMGYLDNPDAEVHAICDKNKRRLKKTAAEYGIKNTFTDYHEMLRDPDLDIIEVLTPHSLHAKMVVEACEAGKHVNLQKVPANTLSDMDAMISAARKAGVKFQVFENSRFHPPYLRALELVESGIIGKPYAVNIRTWAADDVLSSWKLDYLRSYYWRITERENYKMPWLYDDGYHKHSIIHMFLKKIKSVQAWKGGYRMKKVLKADVPAVILYKKSHDKFGTWVISQTPFAPIRSNYYGEDEQVEIHGANGILWINGLTGRMFENCHQGGPGQPGLFWIDRDGEWHQELPEQTDWKWSFINCTRHFIKCVKDDAEPILNGKDARDILQISLAMVKSLRSGFVDVPVKSIKDGIGETLEELDEDGFTQSEVMEEED